MGKKSIKYLKKVYSGVVEGEELTEIILPEDAKEAENIVGTVCFVNLRKREITHGQVVVSGTIGGTAVYSDEQRLNSSIRFSQNFELTARLEEIPENAECTAEVEIVRSELKRINPRKLLVRIILCAKVEVYRSVTAQPCPEMPEGEKIHYKTRSATVFLPAEIRYKPFNISDSNELPQDLDENAEILYATAEFRTDEVKLISHKALVKGEVCFNVVVDCDAKKRAIVWKLPFSQLVELEEAEETGDCRVDLRVKDISAELTAGKIEVNVVAETGVLLFKEESFDYVEDVYSNAYDMKTEREEISAIKFIGAREDVIPVETTVEPPFGTDSVIDAGVRIAEVNCAERDGVMQENIAMDLRLLCGGEDGNILIFKRFIASAPVNCDTGDCFVTACAGELSVTMNAEGVLEIRFEVKCEYKTVQHETIRFVSTAEIKKDCPISTENDPSVVLKRVSGDVSIWTLAKQYHTTVERICSANEIETDSIHTDGKMLYIPKE